MYQWDVEWRQNSSVKLMMHIIHSFCSHRSISYGTVGMTLVGLIKWFYFKWELSQFVSHNVHSKAIAWENEEVWIEHLGKLKKTKKNIEKCQKSTGNLTEIPEPRRRVYEQKKNTITTKNSRSSLRGQSSFRVLESTKAKGNLPPRTSLSAELGRTLDSNYGSFWRSICSRQRISSFPSSLPSIDANRPLDFLCSPAASALADRQHH